MSAPLRLGTRGSDLALWQARHVAARLAALDGGPRIEIVEIRTEGDHVLDLPLSQVPGKAFFTKEIEQALADGTIDLAVHSLKDLPTELPSGLAVGAVLEREDPRDALLTRDGRRLDELAAGARVGTSSLRRRALLARRRPDLELADLRGNVPTRIARLEQGRYDAIVLAAAGVKRLGLEARVSERLAVEAFPPAVAQGAVAVEIRDGDATTARWVGRLDDAPTRIATAAERALLNRLEGGCQVPVGAHATVDGERLEILAVIAALDGSSAVEGRRSGAAAEAPALGRALAEELLERGGGAILEAIRRPAGGAR